MSPRTTTATVGIAVVPATTACIWTRTGISVVVVVVVDDVIGVSLKDSQVWFRRHPLLDIPFGIVALELVVAQSSGDGQVAVHAAVGHAATCCNNATGRTEKENACM